MLNFDNKFIGFGRFRDIHFMPPSTLKKVIPYSNASETMGERIKKLREDRLMTMEELGLLVETFLKLLRVFDVTFEYLIYGRKRR